MGKKENVENFCITVALTKEGDIDVTFNSCENMSNITHAEMIAAIIRYISTLDQSFSSIRYSRDAREKGILKKVRKALSELSPMTVNTDCDYLNQSINTETKTDLS